MPFTVEIGEAKARLSELVAKAEAGQEIIIARGREPVAKLVRLPRPSEFSTVIAEVVAARASRAATRPEELLGWRDEGLDIDGVALTA